MKFPYIHYVGGSWEYRDTLFETLFEVVRALPPDFERLGVIFDDGCRGYVVPRAPDWQNVPNGTEWGVFPNRGYGTQAYFADLSCAIRSYERREPAPAAREDTRTWEEIVDQLGDTAKQNIPQVSFTQPGESTMQPDVETYVRALDSVLRYQMSEGFAILDNQPDIPDQVRTRLAEALDGLTDSREALARCHVGCEPTPIR